MKLQSTLGFSSASKKEIIHNNCLNFFFFLIQMLLENLSVKEQSQSANAPISDGVVD